MDVCIDSFGTTTYKPTGPVPLIKYLAQSTLKTIRLITLLAGRLLGDSAPKWVPADSETCFEGGDFRQLFVFLPRASLKSKLLDATRRP